MATYTTLHGLARCLFTRLAQECLNNCTGCPLFTVGPRPTFETETSKFSRAPNGQTTTEVPSPEASNAPTPEAQRYGMILLNCMLLGLLVLAIAVTLILVCPSVCKYWKRRQRRKNLPFYEKYPNLQDRDHLPHQDGDPRYTHLSCLTQSSQRQSLNLSDPDLAVSPVAPSAASPHVALSLDSADRSMEPAPISMDPSPYTMMNPATHTMDPATRSMDPATRSMDPATRSMDPADLSMDPADLSMDPATRSMDPADLSMDPADLSMDPATRSMDPADLSMDPADLSMDPATRSMDPADLSMDPADLSMDPATRSMDPADLSMDPADLSMDPATRSMDPADLSSFH